jgi:hypothetical protein
VIFLYLPRLKELNNKNVATSFSRAFKTNEAGILELKDEATFLTVDNQVIADALNNVKIDFEIGVPSLAEIIRKVETQDQVEFRNVTI